MHELIGGYGASQAGAGPTGLFLALTLLKNGVQVRVVDGDPHRHPGHRGSGIQVGFTMFAIRYDVWRISNIDTLIASHPGDSSISWRLG